MVAAVHPVGFDNLPICCCRHCWTEPPAAKHCLRVIPSACLQIERSIEASFLSEAEMVFTTLSSTQREVFQKSAGRAPFHTGAALGAGQAARCRCGALQLVGGACAQQCRPLLHSLAARNKQVYAPRLAALPPPHRAVLIDEAGQASEVAALQPLVFGAKR